MTLSPIDREALERSIVIARRDPAYAKSIDSKLADGADWFDVAVSASFHCQMLNLHLSPWQSPPVYAHVEKPRRDEVAAELLDRLLKCGISRFEPDPLEALKEREIGPPRTPPIRIPIY